MFKPIGSERRQHDRKALRSTAQLRFPGSEPLAVQTVDISAGGLCIVASVNPPANASCVVRLNLRAGLQGATAIEVQASVAHSFFTSSKGGFTIGLQFTRVPAEAMQAITAFLNS